MIAPERHGAPPETAPTSARPLVSVVIPTHHRPALLRRAVASVLEQEVPGCDLEVVLGVSDPSSAEDMAAAASLAEDARVRVAPAAGPGAAAARNAALRVARGELVALMDDDCVAQPGWLAAGVRALADADLVQGMTWPAEPVPRWHHTIWVDRLSMLWETCNIFVRREALERGGLFDESWNPTGRMPGWWGEDTEWGWRVVRAGGRPAYAGDALVHHAVTPRDFRAYVAYLGKARYFPALIRHAPEVRRRFYRGYFLNRRHAVISASLACMAAGGVARLAGGRQTGRVLAAAGTAGLLSPARYEVACAMRRAIVETVETAGLAWGSVRYRRVLL